MDEYFVGKLRELKDIESAVSQIEEGKPIRGNELVDIIQAQILSGYCSHSEFALKNNNFKEGVDLLSRYDNMSIQVRYKDAIFDGKDMKAWQKLEIKPEEKVILYAHDLTGNKNRAKTLIDNIERFFGELHTDGHYCGYIHRSIIVQREEGIDVKTAQEIESIASNYSGLVFVRRMDLNGEGTERPVNRISLLLLHVDEPGATLQFLFEPVPALSTKYVYESIAKVLSE